MKAKVATLALRTEVAKQIICTEVIQKMAINNPHVDLWFPAACASMRNDSRNNSRKKPCPLADFYSAFSFHIHFQIKLLLLEYPSILKNEKLHCCSVSSALGKENNLDILFLECLCIRFVSGFGWSLEEHFYSAEHCRDPYHFTCFASPITLIPAPFPVNFFHKSAL